MKCPSVPRALPLVPEEQKKEANVCWAPAMHQGQSLQKTRAVLTLYLHFTDGNSFRGQTSGPGTDTAQQLG